MIQSPDGDVIDCVLSHLQPAFDHPELKGQMPLVNINEKQGFLFLVCVIVLVMVIERRHSFDRIHQRDQKELRVRLHRQCVRIFSFGQI